MTASAIEPTSLDRLPVGLEPRPNGDVRHHSALERLCAFWVLLFGRPQYGGHYVELSRQREGGPFRRGPGGGWFERIPQSGAYARVDLERVAGRILAVAPREHVYMSVLPRAVPSSKGDDVSCACVLWADCDEKRPDSLVRLRHFEPRPTVVVGSGGGRHAYWLLDRPIEPGDARRLGAGIAHSLDADLVYDPQRSLRPPGTLNHKARYGNPRPVELLYVNPKLELVAPNAFRAFSEPPRTKPPRRPVDHGDDPLAAIPPDIYVSLLTGRDPVRRKVRCPLHAGGKERTPSLHIHEHGWYCYGCQTGGGIYQLADLMAGGDGRPRGARFRDLQAELRWLFLGANDEPRPTRGGFRLSRRVRSGARPTVSSRSSFGRKP
jgi:hypothetical protein